MSEKRAKRKLTAIMSADVKGYSRLMGEDELSTVETLKESREIIGKLVVEYQGRVIDSPGDNILSEFSSVVDAVECGVKIQEALKSKNEELPENRQMHFRIGVNLGDVLMDEDRIYGDGVNVAARVESIAEAGEVCISGTVYDHIDGKVPFETKYLGEKTVKNIKKPVRVYRIMTERKTDSKLSEDVQLPDKPSIAVLPFVNMSGDPEQEYFSDGMTEDLITDLSKISGLFVIARNSTFVYKGKPMKAQEISRELGVRFILEGSVRKAGKRIRINAQLIDALSGGHLWAERFDRELVDIFDLQDQVTLEIVTALELNLTHNEQHQLTKRDTNNITAYDYVLRGLESHYRYTREGNEHGQLLFQKAIDLDPDYAMAHALLALATLHSWTQGWNQDLELLPRAFELAQQALNLDDSVPEIHLVLGDLYLFGAKDHDKAAEAFKTAIRLSPNYADAYSGLAQVLAWSGEPEKAIDTVKKAMKLNPHHHAWYFLPLAIALMITERPKDAIEACQKGLNLNPDFLGFHLVLAGMYAEVGREEEAREEVNEVLRISPQFSLDVVRQMTPTKDRELLERLVDTLRMAGLS